MLAATRTVATRVHTGLPFPATLVGVDPRRLCTTDDDLRTLRDLQQWMLTAVTTGNAPDATEHVRGSAARPARDRLDIYAGGYYARLLGALRAEFPTVLALTGDQVFGLFVRAYLQAHPPTSYSLFDVGAAFPAFLDETCPADAGDAGALPAAAARLDLAVRSVDYDSV